LQATPCVLANTLIAAKLQATTAQQRAPRKSTRKLRVIAVSGQFHEVSWV
jgi:hypothetical protein